MQTSSPRDLRSRLEAADGERALCLWDAPAKPNFKSSSTDHFGHAAVNDVFPVQVNFFEGT